MGFLENFRRLFGGSSRPQPLNSIGDGQPILEATMAFFTAPTWDELKYVTGAYWSSLSSSEGDGIIDALRRTFADDAYTLAFLKERSDLLARCRREGVDAVFRGTPQHLKQAPDTLQLFARIAAVRSNDEVNDAARDIASVYRKERKR